MDTKKIIEELGGRKEVISLTGLTRGRISQWVINNKIPRPWIKYFQEKFPKKNWSSLLKNNAQQVRSSPPP